MKDSINAIPGDTFLVAWFLVAKNSFQSKMAFYSETEEPSRENFVQNLCKTFVSLKIPSSIESN